jgi:hypothetical protein
MIFSRLAAGRQCVVDFLGAYRRGTGADPLPISLECGTLLDRTELHAKADTRTKTDIGGSKAVADHIIGS